MKWGEWIAQVENAVWGWTLLLLILGVGLFLTVRTGGVSFRCLGKALRYAVGEEEGAQGEVSAFGALCTALAATIGTGNIVGVATALQLGGPGALFWMVAAAAVGMATKYAEGVLAIRFRQRRADGATMGGPFYYIENGMGYRWRWMGRLFAVFGVLAGTLGIGTAVQSNSITQALNTCFDSTTFTLCGRSYSWVTLWSALIITVLAAAVLLGGIRRIAAVSQVLIPMMGGVYLLIVGAVLWSNATRLPAAVGLVCRSAFVPQAALGAGCGITLKTVVRMGVGRGVFSNEAGMGSAPIAAAAAKTEQPVRQGLVSMTGTFIDTVVLCTLTGLALVVTDAWRLSDIEGVSVTAYAWQQGLPFLPATVTSFLLTLCLVVFAFSTILGWYYYCEQCLRYLTENHHGVVTAHKWMYIGVVLVGPFLTGTTVWSVAGIFNGLMAFPNLVALLALSGVVARETRLFFQKQG